MYTKYLYDASTVNLYIANLGKYNEGELQGGWISLPTEQTTIDEFLSEVVGIDEQYKEWAIHDHESEFIEPGEYDCVYEVNQKAEAIGELEEWQQTTLKAAIEHFGSDALDHDINNFILHTDIHDYYDLGYYWAEESGCYKIGDETLSRYIDYYAFGHDIYLDTNGGFTKYGFIELQPW